MKKLERVVNYDKSGRQLLYVRDPKNVRENTQSQSRGESIDATPSLDAFRDCSGLTESIELPTTKFYQAWKVTIERYGPFSHLFTIALKQP